MAKLRLPYSPSNSEEFLTKYLSKNFYKKSYDRFNWWRTFSLKNKPLKKGALLKDRVLNGDFDLGPYKFEAELIEHKLNKAYQELYPDVARYVHDMAVTISRRKRLLEDYKKDEEQKVKELLNSFSTHYRMSEEEILAELARCKGDSAKDFFYHMEDKFSWK